MLSCSSIGLVGALQFAQSNGREQGKPRTLQVQSGKRIRHKSTHTTNLIERNSTTDALTAAILIYAIGAGITAAAGTRLALQ